MATRKLEYTNNVANYFQMIIQSNVLNTHNFGTATYTED